MEQNQNNLQEQETTLNISGEQDDFYSTQQDINIAAVSGNKSKKKWKKVVGIAVAAYFSLFIIYTAFGEIDDVDADGLTASLETEHGTDESVADTDGDGINDGDEIDDGTDPLINEEAEAQKQAEEQAKAQAEESSSSSSSSGGAVYWLTTSSSYSYHSSPDCSYIAGKDTITSGTTDEAAANGHSDPCDRCY